MCVDILVTIRVF